jgi:N-acetyl-anhydromuramyl-L-alanine amidase AmpD
MLAGFLTLTIVIALGAAALLAATHAPRMRSTAQGRNQAETHDTPHTPVPPPSAGQLEDIVATDAAAAVREWQWVVIHHSATASGSAQSFDEYHRRRGWRGLGYHFVIGNGHGQGDGEIVAGPRWYSQQAGAHSNSPEHNERGIGVCLVGNFEEHAPTPAQMAAARALVAALCERFHIPATSVVGHCQVRNGGATACPGRLMPLDELREGL